MDGFDAPPIPGARASVLVVMSGERERSALKRVLDHSNWLCQYVRPQKTALNALASSAYGVVVTATQLDDRDCWIDVLDLTRTLPGEPRLVVTSPHADALLQAEVLNLRGYDLLVQPFDRRSFLGADNRVALVAAISPRRHGCPRLIGCATLATIGRSSMVRAHFLPVSPGLRCLHLRRAGATERLIRSLTGAPQPA